MSLTAAEREAYSLRDTLTATERAVVESCMRDIAFSARSHRVPLAYDDRAGKLEAALIRYIIDSRQP